MPILCPVGACLDSYPHFTSIDPAVMGYKARHNLALVYKDLGRSDLAEFECRIILDDRPAYGPARKMLGEALLRQRRQTTAQIYADVSIGMPETRLEGLILLAEVAMTRGDLTVANAVYEKALRDFPGDVELLRSRARAMFDHGTLEQARQALDELSRLCPLKPSLSTFRRSVDEIDARLYKIG